MAKKNFINPAAAFISEAEQEEPIKETTTEENTTDDNFFEVPEGYRLRRESKTIRLQLLIRPTTKKYLKQIAEERKVSMNDLVNGILENFIKEENKNAD